MRHVSGAGMLLAIVVTLWEAGASGDPGIPCLRAKVRGQTLGKRLLRVEVIREDSRAPPGTYRVALRACTFLFVDMFVGLIEMLASPERQRPGDVAAGTLVVGKKR